MATVKNQEFDKEHFILCASPCPRFITGGDTHNLLGWERSMLGQLSRELSSLSSHVYAKTPLPENAL